MQGVFSSIIGILILTTVRSYIILTFFKVMFLVMVSGLLHGVFFIPVALVTFLPDACMNRPKAADKCDSATVEKVMITNGKVGHSTTKPADKGNANTNNKRPPLPRLRPVKSY